jgi:hypothetical protein
VSLKDRVGLLSSRRPDGYTGVFAGGYGAAALEDRDRIHRALMQAQHLLGGVAPKRPADRRGVKAARERPSAIGRDGERAYGTAMPAQLRFGRLKAERRPDQHGATDQRDQNETHTRRSINLIS